MVTYKIYLRYLLTGAFLLVFAIATVNVLVDPYAVFGTPRVAGLNELKPFAGDRGRTGKRHQVLQVAPNGLIVGNSRPALGLSPEHPCWPATARPVYNIALPGLSVYQQVRYAQHAQLAGPARALAMGVDFLDFLYAEPPMADPAKWPPVGVDVDAERFAVDPGGRPVSGFRWVRFADYVDAALSIDTFGHSLATLGVQRTVDVNTITAAGFSPAEGTYRPIVRVEGPRVLFEQKRRELAKRLDGTNWHLFGRSTNWSVEFEALRQLIRQSRADGAATVLFMNPYHAEYLLVLDVAGLWPQFEAWKRRLAELARAESVPLWDFSGFGRYSTELVDALPARGTSLDWFWEPAHYRRELGDLMLANIWRAHCPADRANAPRYGVRLDEWRGATTIIDAHLAAQRSALDAYKAEHPDLMARIESLFER